MSKSSILVVNQMLMNLTVIVSELAARTGNIDLCGEIQKDLATMSEIIDLELQLES